MTAEILGYILTGGVAAGLVKILDTLVQHLLSKKDVSRQALLALLHDRLYQACKYHLKNGYASVEEKKNIEYMYIPYKKLGGNGTAEAMYNQCQAMPTESRKE